MPEAGRHRIAGLLFTTALCLATRFDKVATGLTIRFSITESTIHILGQRFVVEILQVGPDALHRDIDTMAAHCAGAGQGPAARRHPETAPEARCSTR